MLLKLLADASYLGMGLHELRFIETLLQANNHYPNSSVVTSQKTKKNSGWSLPVESHCKGRLFIPLLAYSKISIVNDYVPIFVEMCLDFKFLLNDFIKY